MKKNEDKNTLEKISSLAKRRGFIYSGSEIYGGIGGFYDFGPLGTELKFNIKQEWWKNIIQSRDDVFGISAAIVMNPRAWEASGHLRGFSDELLECGFCKRRFRVDEISPDGEHKCPECGETISGKARKFNLMFKTFVGPVEDSASAAYLRPETAGGIFVNFKNVLDTMRVKIPFGIAQIGKAFRNEINPRDFIFRTREFEQMELEYFVYPVRSSRASGPNGTRDSAASATSNGVKPGWTPTDWFHYWIEERKKWYAAIGLKNIRVREQSEKERAHYARATVDIEYKFPFGWQEIEGVANRGDFDLKAHMKVSGADLNYFDEETKERYVPYVIEPSAGVERIALAILCEAYTEEQLANGEMRVVLKLHPKLAPYKAAVFPLLANKPKLVEKAREVYSILNTQYSILPVVWDDRGNIGKRYYSQDEIGTPFCVTVDFESLENDDITVRDRDTMKQERVKIAELVSYLAERLV